jgi:hypothetical protein
VKYKSTSTKTIWPARTATSSEDKRIGAYSIALTIPGKLRCPNKKKKIKRDLIYLYTYIFQVGVFPLSRSEKLMTLASGPLKIEPKKGEKNGHCQKWRLAQKHPPFKSKNQSQSLGV